MPDRCLDEIGEFNWLDRMRRKVPADQRVLIGIGDDAALVRAHKRDILLATDMLIEDRHFKRSEADPEEIGRKALAVNVSDMAAMGGRPTHAVVALGLPGRTRESYLRRLYRGMTDYAREEGFTIVGGDTNRSDKLILAAAMTGETYGPRALTRSGARPGDLIFVTGQLGGSYRSRKHLHFKPRLAEARFLATRYSVGAMMDLSDGLGSDLRRICEQSGTGARVWLSALPVSEHAKNARAALTDGEDFELLFTLSPPQAARLKRESPVLAQKSVGPFCAVGTIAEKRQGLRLLRPDGSTEPLPGGYDHFGGGA